MPYDCFLISETHLMNLGEPHQVEGFVLHGSNRTGPSGSKASGGTGILTRSTIGEASWIHKGNDSFALRIDIDDQPWINQVGLRCDCRPPIAYEE